MREGERDEQVFPPLTKAEGLLLLAHFLGAIAAALSAIAQAIRLSRMGELWDSRVMGQQNETPSSRSTDRRAASSYFDT